jgi:hypothetical protein
MVKHMERKQAVVNFVVVCLVAFQFKVLYCYSNFRYSLLLWAVVLFGECGSYCHIGILFICCLFCQLVVCTPVVLLGGVACQLLSVQVCVVECKGSLLCSEERTTNLSHMSQFIAVF